MMNLLQLKKKLRKELRDIKDPIQIIHPFELLKMKYVQKLEVDFPPVIFRIEKVKDIWKVTISERGKVFENKEFLYENDACLFFNDLVIKD